MELYSVEKCLELARGRDLNKEGFRIVFDSLQYHIQSGETAETAQLNELVDQLLIAVTCLFDDNKRMKQDIEQLKEEIEQLKEEIEQLKEEVKKSPSLEEMEQLKEQVKKLQSLEVNILAGQIALKLEKEFTMILLEDTGIVGNVTLNQIYYISQGGRHCPYKEEQIEKVNENWDKLDEELNLNGENTMDLFAIICDFKTQRNIEAHPNVSLSEASEYLKLSSRISTSDKEKLARLIEQLIKMKVDEIGN